MTAFLVEGIHSAGRIGKCLSALAGRTGNRPIKRAAITAESGRSQRPCGISAMSCAKLSVAAALGRSASRPASRHGSLPCLANSETTLSIIPLASVPTSANKNVFKSDRCKAETSDVATKLS
jgi:hypothetical protein